LELFLFVEIITEYALLMFGVVAVDAEILPVGTIGRIVVVITVFMVNGEEMSVLLIKLPRARGADKAVDAD
jgi:hypothetical protein